MITCSPASYNESETLSTLRYKAPLPPFPCIDNKKWVEDVANQNLTLFYVRFGSRAKMIKNKAKMNRERSKIGISGQIGGLKA